VDRPPLHARPSALLEHLPLHLQSDFCDLQRVCHNDLGSSSGTTGSDFGPERDPAGLGIGELAADEVVDGQLDGWRRGRRERAERYQSRS
jgi:hypothetical protein